MSATTAVIRPAVSAMRWVRARPLLARALQVVLVAVIVAFCAWAVRNEWSKAGTRLENANLGWLALSLALVAVYYLVFILGWIRMLRAWSIDVPYRVALQAEMVSMLAKYVPGGIWTPAATTT